MKLQKYISFSGGVESTTMCILYGKGAKAIFADTGAEHKELYERINLVRDYCTKLHDGDFELIQVKASRTTKDGSNFTNLTDYIVHEEYMPSLFARFCTRLFKIFPIEKFIRSEILKSKIIVPVKYKSGFKKGKTNWSKTYEKYTDKNGLTKPIVEIMIGLNYDESDRKGNLEEIKLAKYSYPLADNELDRDDCIEILNLHGLNPDFPIYMQRGGCKYCFFKKQAEFKAMYYFDRSTFEEVRQLEKDVQGSSKKFFSIMPSGKSMDQLANECESEIMVWTEEIVKSLYQKIEKTTYCGGFCHR